MPNGWENALLAGFSCKSGSFAYRKIVKIGKIERLESSFDRCGKGGPAFLAVVYDVLLVRHGESEANKAGRLAYRTWDPPLTELGQSQAVQLMQQLQDWPVKHLVTSPLLRAQMTLKPLADHLGVVPTVLPGLAEVNLGQWDGQRLKDLETANSLSFRAWRQDPEKNPPPDGESIMTVGQRVLAALETYLVTREPGSTVAATHADCIKGAVLVILKAGGPSARSLWVPNGGQLFIRYNPPLKQWGIIFSPLQKPWIP